MLGSDGQLLAFALLVVTAVLAIAWLFLAAASFRGQRLAWVAAAGAQPGDRQDREQREDERHRQEEARGETGAAGLVEEPGEERRWQDRGGDLGRPPLRLVTAPKGEELEGHSHRRLNSEEQAGQQRRQGPPVDGEVKAEAEGEPGRGTHPGGLTAR